MRTRSKRSMLWLALLGGCPSAVLAAPTDFAWNGGSGNFNSANWTKTGDLADVSTFPNDSDDNVIFNTGSASNYTLTAPTGVTTTFGALTASDASTSLDLLGSPTIMQFAGALTVGSTNPGGAKLVLTSTSGAATKGILQVSGTPAVSIANGANLVGTVEVRNGARFSRSGAGTPIIGNGAGAFGTFLVDGAGSTATLSGSSMTVAQSGARADITVQNGGTFNTTELFLATTGTNPTVNITVDNGTFNNTNNGITFGSTVTGQTGGTVNILVENGGLLSATGQNILITDARIRAVGKTVSETITGTNGTTASRVRSAGHYVGGGVRNAMRSNHGVLVEDGGVLAATSVLKSWQAVTGGTAGVITLDDGNIELGTGTPTGAAARFDTFGVLRGTGTIRRLAGTGNAFAVNVVGGVTDIFDNTNPGADIGDAPVNGELRPGDLSATPAIGAVTIQDGDFNLTSNGTNHGRLFLDVASPSSYDRLIVEDTLNTALVTATLNGALDYTLAPGFAAPPAGGFLDFVLAEDIAYAPASDNLASLLTGLGYTQGAGPSQFQYGVVTVGATDYAGGQYSGYEALRLSFNAAPIPEPASAALLGLGAVLMVRRRR